MTSPDLPSVATLTLHKVNENDLVDAALAALQVELPEWIPQEGATEVVLIESLALIIGQQVYALNQLPRVVLDALIAVRGISRHPGVVSSGALLVTLAASTVGTRTVPLGARFRLPVVGGTVDVSATEVLEINPSDGLTGLVHVSSVLTGTAANGIGIGSRAQVVDALAWMESAVVSTVMGGGADPETDVAYYSRAAATFQREHGSLVMDSQFATAALDVIGVGRAGAWGLWDGTGSPGSDAGHLTVAVAAPDGAPVTSPIKAEVGALLAESAVAGLTIHVIDFTLVTMAITLTYVLTPGYLAATVNAAIVAELTGWLSPASWPLGQELAHANQVVLRLGMVPGVSDVTALSGWSAVTGTATLPNCTSVTPTAS